MPKIGADKLLANFPAVGIAEEPIANKRRVSPDVLGIVILNNLDE